MTFQNTTPSVIRVSTEPQNQSIIKGCTEIRFTDWEFLPWNNSYNLVSRETIMVAVKVRTNMLVLLFLIGGPANVINMAVFFKQGLNVRVNLLLFSLSLADELYLIVCTAQYFQEFYFQFLGTTKISPVLVFLLNNYFTGTQGIGFVSFLLSALIACDRCYSVVRPLQYQNLIHTKTLALIIFAIHITTLALYFVVVSRYHIACFYDPEAKVKAMLYRHSEFYANHKDLVDYIDSVVFGVVFQTGMLIMVTTATVITVHTLRRAMAWRSAESSSLLSAKEVALTKMLIGTSILLIICVSPSGFLRVTGLFLPDLNTGGRLENFYATALRICQTFAYVNSSFNIFVYYVMGTKYRDTLLSIVKRVRRRK